MNAVNPHKRIAFKKLGPKEFEGWKISRQKCTILGKQNLFI